MQKQLEKFSNQARFIQMIIDGKLIVSKKKKVDLVTELKQKKFKPFPKVSDAAKEGELEPVADNEDDSDNDVEASANAYDYLLGVSVPLSQVLIGANSAVDGHLVFDTGTRREAPEADRRQRRRDRRIDQDEQRRLVEERSGRFSCRVEIPA